MMHTGVKARKKAQITQIVVHTVIKSCTLNMSHACRVDGPVADTGSSVGYFTVTASGSKGKTHPVDVQVRC